MLHAQQHMSAIMLNFALFRSVQLKKHPGRRTPRPARAAKSLERTALSLSERNNSNVGLQGVAGSPATFATEDPGLFLANPLKPVGISHSTSEDAPVPKTSTCQVLHKHYIMSRAKERLTEEQHITNA